MEKKEKKETKQKFEPVVKADDQVVFDENEPENYSEFEYLQTQVEILRETVDELVAIFRAKDITRTEIIEADYCDDDEVFKRLEDRKGGE